jgi:hypothetical protein
MIPLRHSTHRIITGDTPRMFSNNAIEIGHSFIIGLSLGTHSLARLGFFHHRQNKSCFDRNAPANL